MWEILVLLLFLLMCGVVEALLPKKESKPRRTWEPKPDKEEYREMLREPEWQVTRTRILNRDDHLCRICNSSYNLQVHHTAYLGYHPSDTPDEYLLTLCRHCHTEVHSSGEHQFTIRDMVDKAIKSAEAALDNAAIMGEEEAKLEMERFQREHEAAIEELRTKHAAAELNK